MSSQYAPWDYDGYRWARASRYGPDCVESTNTDSNEPPYSAKACFASAGRKSGWDDNNARGNNPRKLSLNSVCLPGNDKEYVYCTTGGGE